MTGPRAIWTPVTVVDTEKLFIAKMIANVLRGERPYHVSTLVNTGSDLYALRGILPFHEEA